MTPELLAAIVAGGVVGWLAAGRPKAQEIRLLDVWALGPVMIYAATLDRRRRSLEAAEDWPAYYARLALAGAGAATITYNGRNYLWAL